MEFIIEFYKGLDMLNLIIFWGIIIVIILLLIFSMILINKNKKLKLIVEKQKTTDEDLPIIKEEIKIEKSDDNIPEELEIENYVEEEMIELEAPVKKQDVIEYRNNLFEQSNQTNKIEVTKKTVTNLEMPNAPYQRNVLREMSLSQTSPIGINREVNKTNQNMEIIKDLNESLDEEKIEKTLEVKEYQKEEKTITETKNTLEKSNQFITKDFTPNYGEKRKNDLNEEKNNLLKEEISNFEDKTNNKGNEYLEEVSRKLAEADIPDEIERTNYELKQEEDAIISYKELMEKKDSIQTIDEEEAIISIEELMNRTNESKTKEEISKLYNLSEEEENDNFIKELKQFRNDL